MLVSIVLLLLSTPRGTTAIVRELNPKNFMDIDHRAVLLNFYAPWCNRCSEMAPHWERLEDYYQKDPNVLIAKVNTAKYPSLAKRYGVESHPHIVWFHPETHEHAPEPFVHTPTFSTLSQFVEVKRREVPHGRYQHMDAVLHAAHECTTPACFQRTLFAMDHHGDKFSADHAHYYTKVASRAKRTGEAEALRLEQRRLLAKSKHDESPRRERRLAKSRYNILKHVLKYH
jgi:thiol-disulfide isomerase/thioredoxin